MTDLEKFGKACQDAKDSFVSAWNALLTGDKTDANYQILAQKERDEIDEADAKCRTNPPGHPIRPH